MKTTWQKIITFFTANKVFILGLLASIAVVLQQFLMEPSIDWKTVGLAAGIAVLSYVANLWRGQGVTILGIIGTLAYVFVQNLTSGIPLDWSKIILMAVVAIISAVAPPPKSINYEKSPVIEKAKEQAAVITEQIKTDTLPVGTIKT
jgi:hypothetical protein